MAAAAAALEHQPNQVRFTLTLLQANLLGGFWARQADGHPGPDLMGRGLLVLNALVNWERMKQTCAQKKGRPPKTAAASRVSLS